MSIADLINSSDPMFSFSHQQEHNSLVFSMAAPHLFNLASYLLDPSLGNEVMQEPNLWAMKHQQAHDDAAAWYGVQPSLPMVDSVLTDPWTTFINYTEHLALNGAALASSRRTTSGG